MNLKNNNSMGLLPFDLGGTNGGLPTAVAIPRVSNNPDGFLFGEKALASGSEFALLANWKMLLGKTELEVMTERKNSDPLNRALERASLEEIASRYFEFILKGVTASGRFEKMPEVVVGIPAAAAKTTAARTRYRRIIEKAFVKANAPKPRFFLEPFAVFQHHLFSGDITDTGKSQNVLVVDIGGGTTNACIIQTSVHGRLARGGDNHKPHGVETFEMGGSDIDGMILNRIVRSTRIRDMRATVLARLAKERICAILNRQGWWDDEKRATGLVEIIELEDQGKWPVTGFDVAQIVEHRFWPSVKATIAESLNSFSSAQADVDSDTIDVVIFAGGTCQIRLLHTLFRRDFGHRPQLKDHKFVVSPTYDRAVASGLALEASANSRLHDVKPTRIAPYLQNDLQFAVGHSVTTIASPTRLTLQQGPVACEPSDGNVILKAPVSSSELTGHQIEWNFQLRQQPDRICLRFSQLDDDGELALIQDCAVKVARKGELAGQKCRLRMRFHDDGVADVGVLAWNNSTKSNVYYDATRLDLHELRDFKGEVFVGLDFGTTNTFLAQALARTDQHEALPSKYVVDPATMERGNSLQSEIQTFLATLSDRAILLNRYEEQLIRDYVYHSNRIEGSILTRGQTGHILRELPDAKSLTERDIIGRVEEVAFVDEKGEVRTISRPIRDQVAAVNLRDAFLYVRELATEEQHLTPFYLKSIHNLVVRGELTARPGQFRNDNVKISHATFVPPDATQVEQLIKEMCDFFGGQEFGNWPPIYQATYAHARFVSIHPFHDGNGRLARLVANYFLWRASIPGVMLPWENRDRYYDALEECNTFENQKRGTLDDLATLFFDLFEDAIRNIKAMAALERTEAIEEPVIAGGSAKSNRLNALLARIGTNGRAIDVEAQYASWCASFGGLLQDVKEGALLVGGAFRERWGGAVTVREYPIVDLDTFRAMREGAAYSRTWFFSLSIAFPQTVQDIVFFFGRASMHACRLDGRFERTASLGVARMDRALMKHVNVYQESWSTIKEIAHDGASMALCAADTHKLRLVPAGTDEFNDWFAILIEDATIHLGKVDLDN